MGVNYHTFMLLAVCWTSLIGDSPLGLKDNKVINRFLNQFLHDPVAQIARYSEIASQLEDSLIVDCHGVDISVDVSTIFYGTPVFLEYRKFRETREPALLQYLLSFCTFGKKVSFEDPNLDSIALRKWMDVEDRLGGLVIPEWVVNLKLIMDYLTADWDDFTFLPKHGGGSVANPRIHGLVEKNEQFTVTPSIRYMYLTDKMGNSDCSSTFYTPSGGVASKDKKSYRTESKLMFVPKSYKTSRSICMEPLGNQWAQQGVRAWFEHHMSRGILGRFIFLKDQSENQKMAAFGSLTRLVDTIDLSSASDSVAWKLVRVIFRASILKHLQATRSRVVELPDGTMHLAHKFAPMGSALCFPVQSTIYAAIVLMVSIAQVYGREWTKPGSLSDIDLNLAIKNLYGDGRLKSKHTKGHIPFRCYGDDITCDHRVTSNVIDCLQQLGFDVNVEKSFIGNSSYRESCGEFYHNGERVTPIRFKTEQLHQRITVEDLASIIDMANRALEYGYRYLRKHIIQYALYVDIQGVQRAVGARNPILFVSTEDKDSSMAIRCVEPRNKHLRRRGWDPLGPMRTYPLAKPGKPIKGLNFKGPSNHSYQVSEFRSLTLGPSVRRKQPKKFDNYFYVSWWRSRYFAEARGDPSNNGFLYLLRSDSKVQIDSVSLHPEDKSVGTSCKTADVLRTDVKWRWTPT